MIASVPISALSTLTRLQPTALRAAAANRERCIANILPVPATVVLS